MQENTNTLLSRVVDTFTGKPIYQLTIPVRWLPVPAKRTILDKIFNRNRIVEREPETIRIYDIWPCVVGNQFRIAGRAALLPDEVFSEHNEMLSLTPDHLPHLLYIIAAAIQNNHLEPDPGLIDFLKWNLDNIDILQAVLAAMDNTNMDSFINSIVSMKGKVKILQPEASPEDGSELIASHIETSDRQVNTSDGQSGT